MFTQLGLSLFSSLVFLRSKIIRELVDMMNIERDIHFPETILFSFATW